LRTVVGLTGIAILRALALLLRVLGNGTRHLGVLAQRLYDLPLFLPLWIEARTATVTRLATDAAGSGEAGTWQEARP
jgi:hypothetical protein